jgi:uncharacterized membrane-anchored protein
MKIAIGILLASLFTYGFAQQDPQSVRNEFLKLKWQLGPTNGQIASKATIAVPKEYLFLDGPNTRRFLELMGNPPQDDHYTYAPSSMSWFSIFSFNASGYVKDDEKIDPDALLQSLKNSDRLSNEERKRLGMAAIYTEGWQVQPHYDLQTKRLEWGVRLRTDKGEKVVNYTSRLLGRSGVMSATLVSDPGQLPQNVEEFKHSLEGFVYASGEKYSEFKSGDKIAEYGLAALILGGAAAVATKKGFWAAIVAFLAAFWKLIGVAVVGVLAWLGSLFKRKRS